MVSCRLIVFLNCGSLKVFNPFRETFENITFLFWHIYRIFGSSQKIDQFMVKVLGCFIFKITWTHKILLNLSKTCVGSIRAQILWWICLSPHPHFSPQPKPPPPPPPTSFLFFYFFLVLFFTYWIILLWKVPENS